MAGEELAGARRRARCSGRPGCVVRATWSRRGSTPRPSRPTQVRVDARETLARVRGAGRPTGPRTAPRAEGGGREPSRPPPGAHGARRGVRSWRRCSRRFRARRPSAGWRRHYRRRHAPLQHAQPPARRAAAAARADRHVRLRPDGLPAHPRRQRAPVRVSHVAAELAARARLRGDVRPQHHRRQRQDLRRGPGRSAELAAGRPSGTSRTPPARARPARRGAEGDRDDPRDRRAIEELVEGGLAYEAGGDVYFRVARDPRLRPALRPAAGPDGRRRSRIRSRRIRATSRSGRRPSRARTPRGTRPGGAAARAGTSSARRWPRRSSARRSRSTAAGSTSSSRTTRTSCAQSRRAGREFAQIWMHNGMLELHRREDVEVARQRRSRCATCSTSGAARRCCSSS